MKYLIFSDSHLTDIFDERKYNFLTRIIKAVDRVIINGDFWDGYVTNFSGFVKSPWKKLFPLLLIKKTIYLFGNHDRKKFADSRVNLFSVDQREEIEIKSGQLQLHIEHGNRIFGDVDRLLPRKLAAIIIGIIAARIRYQYKLDKQKVLEIYAGENRHYKKMKRKDKKIYIFGHSHGAELSADYSFANSGFIRWGYGSYLTIENGKIDLKIEDY